ncbi:MAG: DUF2855 family protein [Arenicella sp.]|nr:DUF2855 family protein [Arenicella sp.]
MTVWGMADVVESKSSDIDVGERLYGVFPMSSHLVMMPGRVKDENFIDMAAHRQELPALYNQYSRTRSEPKELQAIEDQRCVLFPLFMTGYVIADFLLDNEWFDVQQIIIGSASSKTGIGLAKFIKENDFQGKVIGLTSNHNKAFVDDLGMCDQVIVYDEVESIDNHPSVFVDMSGDGPTRARLHHHLSDNMKNTQLVGITHWDAQRVAEKLPGAKPEFFFTPAQIERRDDDWGTGVLMQQGYAASAELALQLKDQLTIEHYQGADACATVWRDMLDNKISGQRGIMVSLRSN